MTTSALQLEAWREYSNHLQVWLEQTVPIWSGHLLQTLTQPASELENALAQCENLTQIGQRLSLPEIQRPAIYTRAQTLPENRRTAGIPGKKLQQISALLPHLPDSADYLEWCAGKGYLGALVSEYKDAKVSSLERNAQLCQSGMQRAAVRALNQQFHCQDVLAAERTDYYHRQQARIALHACGSLHEQMLLDVQNWPCQFVLCAPCCYHLRDHSKPVALSHWGQAQNLPWSRAALHLPAERCSTGGARAHKAQIRQQYLRALFDVCQRRSRGRDEYLALPAVPAAMLRCTDLSFLNWASQETGVYLHPLCEADRRAARAHQRLWQQRQRLRSLLAPMIEDWLLADRLWLGRQLGYRTQWLQFADASVAARGDALLWWR